MVKTNNSVSSGTRGHASKASAVAKGDGKPKAVAAKKKGKSLKPTASSGSPPAAVVSPAKASAESNTTSVVIPHGGPPKMVFTSDALISFIVDLKGEYDMKSFGSVEGAIKYFASAMESYTKNLVSNTNTDIKASPVAASGRPAVSLTGDTIAQHMKLPAVVPAANAHVIAKAIPSISKSDRMEKMRKAVASKQQKPTDCFRLLYVEHPIDKGDVVFALDLWEGKGEVFWQFKADIFTEAVKNTIVDIPGYNSIIWQSLETGKFRKTPYGPNESRKTDRNWDINTVWGIYPFNALSSITVEASLEAFGHAVKEIVAMQDFRDFYIEGVEMSFPNLIPYMSGK